MNTKEETLLSLMLSRIEQFIAKSETTLEKKKKKERMQCLHSHSNNYRGTLIIQKKCKSVLFLALKLLIQCTSE